MGSSRGAVRRVPLNTPHFDPPWHKAGHRNGRGRQAGQQKRVGKTSPPRGGDAPTSNVFCMGGRGRILRWIQQLSVKLRNRIAGGGSPTSERERAAGKLLGGTLVHDPAVRRRKRETAKELTPWADFRLAQKRPNPDFPHRVCDARLLVHVGARDGIFATSRQDNATPGSELDQASRFK